MRTRSAIGIWLAAALVCALSLPAFAQSPSGGQAPSQDLLKPEQLEQLVAPIALYPDPLLAEVLMAATYPLEVVSADRWVKQNKNLKGDQLKSAVEKQKWDESVMSLTATPDVLSMMSEKLDWTQQLGDAVLAQQPDVMDAIQRLRTKAQNQKKLASTKEQTVATKKEQGRDVIVIEPAVPDTIYVPYYDPAVVYGGWPYPAYPPYFFPRPGYIAGSVIAAGIAFGTGYAVGRWVSNGNYWGGGVNWGGNTINVNRPINIDNTKINNFVHNPEHRHGVRYNNDNVKQKFSNRPAGAGDRQLDFRGHDGQQVVRPDRDGPRGDHANLGDRRPGGGDGPKIDRPGGDRPKIDRPAGGNKPDIKRPASSGGAHKPKVAHGGGGALSHIDRGGGAARAQAARGKASLGHGGPHVGGGGGGGRHISAGGGGGRAGGGGGRGGGGRRR